MQNVLGHDPYNGAVYLFRSKRGDQLKCLVWDQTGLIVRGTLEPVARPPHFTRSSRAVPLPGRSRRPGSFGCPRRNSPPCSITHVDTPHCQADRFSNPVRRSRDFVGSAPRPTRLTCRETDRHRLAEG
ncbi:IS66 family insertion sequence element accessory protein TnpB [Rhodobacter capsulatus]|uniref:IS66 family insertion sequence element accessory protein TnpB n=1 Tax=Rhodobacter capsulatus TaxID=1061 RepID=UPI004028B354